MSPEDFEARIIAWASQQKDLAALVLAGSRAGDQQKVDGWSDWDFHLISKRPERYQNADWVTEIAPCWCAHSERTPRGVIKVSAVFEEGLEADFVPLAAWQMKVVYWAMRRPQWLNLMPNRLWRGILETRHFLLGSGYRLLVGSADWERRLEALQLSWPSKELSPAEIKKHADAFWQKSVWVFKKIARPEPRSAMHWLHLLVVNHVYAMLEEEARLAGRMPRPEARKAESWLDERRLVQTTFVTGPDPRVLAKALLGQISLFREVSESVARQRKVALPDYRSVEQWLRSNLETIAAAESG